MLHPSAEELPKSQTPHHLVQEVGVVGTVVVVLVLALAQAVPVPALVVEPNWKGGQKWADSNH